MALLQDHVRHRLPQQEPHPFLRPVSRQRSERPRGILGTGGFPLQRGQHVQHQQELQGRPPHRRRAGHIGQQRRKPQLDDQRAGLPRLPGPRIPLRRDQQRQNAGSGVFRGRKHADVLHRPHGLQLQGPLRADGHVPRRRQQQVLQGEPLQLLPLVFGGMAHVRREIHEEPEFHLQPQAARRLGHGRQSGPEPLPDADHLQLDVYGRPQFGLFGIARRPVRHRHQAQHHVQPGAQMGDHRAV